VPGVALLLGLACPAQTATVTLTPSADAFVRAPAPASNYGAAGALTISGSAAVNGSGQTNGLADSLLRFPLADAVSSFNDSLGSNRWVVTAATLTVTEAAAPNNPIFDRGVGAFEIRWMANDDWLEGTGKPITPTDDGITYQDLPATLGSADISLGFFTNSGADGPISFGLPLVPALRSNVVAGADLNLYLTAAGADIGFTFNSRNFTDSNAWPMLQLTALPRPPMARISAIQRLELGQIAIRFDVLSNWTYTLQGIDALPSAPSTAWFDLLTVRPVADDQVLFVETGTNRQRFYRLSVSR